MLFFQVDNQAIIKKHQFILIFICFFQMMNVSLPYQITTTMSNTINNNTMRTIYAKINTKSNFRSLNGIWLQVESMNGKRVTCYFEDLKVDFTLNEISEFKY